MLVTGSAAASALLSTGIPKPSSTPTGPGGKAHPLLDVVRARDPARAAALEDGLAQGEQAVDQLDAAKEAMKEGRKEAARQKVDRLKAQLQALRLLATTDPDGAAQEAARLARQLASAVNEYVRAGGPAGAGTGAALAVPGAAPDAGSEATDGAATPSLRDPDTAFAGAARDAMARIKAILEVARRGREDEADRTETDRRDAVTALTAAEAALLGLNGPTAPGGAVVSVLV